MSKFLSNFLNKLPRILPRANTVMIVWAALKIIDYLCTRPSFHLGRLISLHFWINLILGLGPLLFFLYLARLNRRTVRLRLAEGRPAEGKVLPLNAAWLAWTLLWAIPISFRLLLNPWVLFYAFFLEPEAVRIVLYTLMAWLEVLYLVANGFYAALERPRLGPGLRRRLKTGDGPIPPPRDI